MGNFSLVHWIVVLVVVLVLFGRGRISETMGDFGKGLSAFKKGLADEERGPHAASPRPEALTHQPSEATAPASVTSGEREQA